VATVRNVWNGVKIWENNNVNSSVEIYVLNTQHIDKISRVKKDPDLDAASKFWLRIRISKIIFQTICISEMQYYERNVAELFIYSRQHCMCCVHSAFFLSNAFTGPGCLFI
jgi:hypothetical protein